MSNNRKRAVLKVSAIVALIAAIAVGIVYLVVAGDSSNVKKLGGYVRSVEKISDTEYKATVGFFRDSKEVATRTITESTEPKIGDTKYLYYMAGAEDNLLDEEPNLYIGYVWLGAIAGGLLLVAIILFVCMNRIVVRHNAKVGKKIKVDPNAMLKK